MSWRAREAHAPWKPGTNRLHPSPRAACRNESSDGLGPVATVRPTISVDAPGYRSADRLDAGGRDFDTAHRRSGADEAFERGSGAS